MPNIDPEARRWELDLAGRVGRAVACRRRSLGLTAVQLADRTKELGYPITRVAVTKIEKNQRSGKVDVAEVLVLATALEIPPILLLLPDYPEGTVELIPNHVVHSRWGARWVCGMSPLPPAADADEEWSETSVNAGIELIAAGERLDELQVEEFLVYEKARKARTVAGSEPDAGLASSMRVSAERRLEAYRAKMSAAAVRVQEMKALVWGSRGDG